MRAVRRLVVCGVVTFIGCTGAPVEDGLFFPTFDTQGALPTAIVQGVLMERDRCLFVDRTLVVWEAGLGFEDGALLDREGAPIARVGDLIYGGGGYWGQRGHFEDLAGEPIPERCVPSGDGDRFALIYEVEAGEFE